MYRTSDYEKAREKLKKAESQSDLQTEPEDDDRSNKRKKRPNPRYEDSDSSPESSPENSPRRSPRKLISPIYYTHRKSPRKEAVQKRFQSCVMPELPAPPSPVAGMSSQITQPVTPKTATCSRSDPISAVSASKPRTSEFEIKVLRSFEQIKQHLTHNSNVLSQIVKKLDSAHHIDALEMNDEEMPTLPVKSKEELNSIEVYLRNEPARNQLIRYLGSTGGDNLKQCVRRIMAMVLENDVAKTINWLGRGEKQAFSQLTLKDVVLKAVKRNHKFKDSGDKEIEDGIKEWLRFSIDREGGRKERREKKRAAEQEAEEERQAAVRRAAEENQVPDAENDE